VERFRASKGDGSYREIVAESEIEALDMLAADEILVRHVSEKEARTRRLDTRMAQRVQQDAAASQRRHAEARARFVSELTSIGKN
jgi:hypothetical protein